MFSIRWYLGLLEAQLGGAGWPSGKFVSNFGPLQAMVSLGTSTRRPRVVRNYLVAVRISQIEAPCVELSSFTIGW